MSFPTSPLRLLPTVATLVGWDSHPLKFRAFSRRTEYFRLTRWFALHRLRWLYVLATPLLCTEFTNCKIVTRNMTTRSISWPAMFTDSVQYGLGQAC